MVRRTPPSRAMLGVGGVGVIERVALLKYGCHLKPSKPAPGQRYRAEHLSTNARTHPSAAGRRRKVMLRKSRRRDRGSPAPAPTMLAA